MDDRPYRTAKEVAAELGVSLRTVRRWVADGRLNATRVGRSVRIPVGAYRGGMSPSSSGWMATASTPVRRTTESAGVYAPDRVTGGWPDTPERLAEQRGNAAALMDRLAARGRPASGPGDTVDAILDAVREEFGAAPLGHLSRAGSPGRPAARRPGQRPTS